VVATVARWRVPWLPAGFRLQRQVVPFYFLFTALLALRLGELFRLIGRWLELDVWQAPFAIVLAASPPDRRFHSRGVAMLGTNWTHGTTPASRQDGLAVYQGIVRMLTSRPIMDVPAAVRVHNRDNYLRSTEATMALPY